MRERKSVRVWKERDERIGRVNGEIIKSKAVESERRGKKNRERVKGESKKRVKDERERRGERCESKERGRER